MIPKKRFLKYLFKHPFDVNVFPALLINKEYPDNMKKSVIKTAPILTKSVRKPYFAPK